MRGTFMSGIGGIIQITSRTGSCDEAEAGWRLSMELVVWRLQSVAEICGMGMEPAPHTSEALEVVERYVSER